MAISMLFCFVFTENYSDIQNKTLKGISSKYNMSEHIWIICEDLLLTLFLMTHTFKYLGKKTEDGREPRKLAVWVHVHVHDREIVKHFGWKHLHLYPGYISVLNWWFCFSLVVTEMLRCKFEEFRVSSCQETLGKDK